MDVISYQNLINDVIEKCPIEAGIEVIVYMLLYDVVDKEKLSLIDINRLRQGRDRRLENDAGISDLAIVSKDFEYHDDKKADKGTVFAFVEVKFPGNFLRETEQIEAGYKSSPKYICTDGLIWKIYQNKEPARQIDLREDKTKTVINEERYNELKNFLKNFFVINKEDSK